MKLTRFSYYMFCPRQRVPYVSQSVLITHLIIRDCQHKPLHLESLNT
jgi:hypothetical protein